MIRIIRNAAVLVPIFPFVKKKIGKKILLKDIDFEAQKGDFVLILGGSGAGKTTLVNAILGESKADGKIILNGLDL